MINLRYHIVSLTAVFLAIGIGIAFGSSFLDQATVNSLERQLDGLQAGLADRDDRISELGDEVSDLTSRQSALDAEGSALLDGRAEDVPVVIIANDGTDDTAIDNLVASLVAADADVAGVWRFTDRFILDDEGEVDDLSEVTESESATPSMLRRDSVDALAAVIADQQAAGSTSTLPPDGDAEGDAEGGDGDVGSEPEGDEGDATDGESQDDTTLGGSSSDAVADQEVVDELFDRGFIEYTRVADGPDRPFVPAGARIVLIGGADSLPDGWMLLPLAEALQDGPDGASLVVATSAVPDGGGMSSLVSTIREDAELRDLVTTVEDATHLPGQAALVLVLADLGTGPIGHYGLADGSTRLLPASPGS